MKKLEYLLIAILALFILFFFYNKGLNTADEGYILHSAQRLHNGEIPYRDFNFIYTPGSILLISATYSILSESILAGRILVVVVAVLTSLLIYAVSYKLSKNLIIAVYSVLIYLAWAPSHTNFPLPILFCLLTGMLSFFIFLRVLETKKFIDYLLLGFVTFLTFFFKQNFGIGLFIFYLIVFITNRKLFKNSKLYFAGFGLGAIAFVAYLILTQSSSSLLSYSYYSFQEYFIRHTINAPFPLDWTVYSFLKILFYLSPLLVSGFVIFYSLKKKNKLLYISSSLFVMSYYLVGIYPSTDFVHLSPLISLLGLPLAICAKGKRKLIFYFVFVFIIIFGFYTALFKGYYRWGYPILEHNFYLDHPRMKVWYKSSDILNVVNYIQKKSARSDYIYFYFFEPMFYFISDRKNPIRYYDSFFLSLGEENKYAKSIDEKKTKLVISSAPISGGPRYPLPNYILSTYEISATIGAYTVWTRKN